MVQWLRLYTSNAIGMGLIPGQGTKIPQALRQEKKMELHIPYDSAITLLDSITRISSNVYKMTYTNMLCIYNNNTPWYIHIIHYK